MSNGKRIFHISNRVVIPDGNGSAGGLDETICDPPEGYNVVRFGWSGKVVPDSEFREEDSIHVTTQNGVEYITLDLKKSDFSGFYEGFSNSVLWPLFHFRNDLVEFNSHDLATYIKVNEKFAQIAAKYIKQEDVVLVHDYHLIPCGAELQKVGVKNPTGFFLHIPSPDDNLLANTPSSVLDHEQRQSIKHLLHNLFAYHMVGFQTPQDMINIQTLVTNNPLPTAVGMLETKPIIDLTRTFKDRATHFGVFPAMGQTLRHAATAKRVEESQEVKEMIESLGGAPDIVSLDRLDYSKGIVSKLRGYLFYLMDYVGKRESSPSHLFQVAALGRDGVKAYQIERCKVETVAETIQQRFGDHVLKLDLATVKRDTILGVFRASNVGLITPLRDGMNVTAFEYLGAQNPEDPGVLVLSKYAGAATVLPNAAIMVDPRDPSDIARGIHQAKTMSLEDRKLMHKEAMEFFHRHTNQTWLGSIVNQTLSAAGQQPA